MPPTGSTTRHGAQLDRDREERVLCPGRIMRRQGPDQEAAQEDRATCHAALHPALLGRHRRSKCQQTFGPPASRQTERGVARKRQPEAAGTGAATRGSEITLTRPG